MLSMQTAKATLQSNLIQFSQNKYACLCFFPPGRVSNIPEQGYGELWTSCISQWGGIGEGHCHVILLNLQVSIQAMSTG